LHVKDIFLAAENRNSDQTDRSDGMQTLVHALNLSQTVAITVTLSYCLIRRLSVSVTRRLQPVLHAAARLITGVHRNNKLT